MKTIDHKTIAADAVMVEVRQAKTKLAGQYDFDVIAMVESLRNMDAEEKISRNQANPSDSTIMNLEKQP